MKIDDLTLDKLRALIAAADDNAGHHILWVDKSGEIHLPLLPVNPDEVKFPAVHPDLVLQYEVFCKGNEYVGPNAATDMELMTRLYDSLLKEWKEADRSKPVYVDFW